MITEENIDMLKITQLMKRVKQFIICLHKIVLLPGRILGEILIYLFFLIDHKKEYGMICLKTSLVLLNRRKDLIVFFYLVLYLDRTD